MVSSNRWTGGVRSGAGGEDTAVTWSASDGVRKSRHSSAGGPLTQAKGRAKRASTGPRRPESPCGGAIFFSPRHVVHRRCTVLPQDFHRRVRADGPLTLGGTDTTLRSSSQVMALPWPNSWIGPATAAVLCVVAAAPVWADEPPLFRLFLRDGPVVTCLGEYARLDTHVVCSLPIDGAETTELVSLRADRVDWVRTEDYTVALRAARYAEARGEHDFAELSGDVARLLNEVGQTTDNARRLGLALEARRRLSEWPARHHNYRACRRAADPAAGRRCDLGFPGGGRRAAVRPGAACHSRGARADALACGAHSGGGRDGSRRRGRTDRECRRARVAARGDCRDHRAVGRAAARGGPRAASDARR